MAMIPRAPAPTLIGAVVLMAPSLLNGAPVFYFDSAAYIAQVAKAWEVLRSTAEARGAPEAIVAMGALGEGAAAFGTPQEDGVVMAGRSIYYGALAHAGWITTIWLPVVVQALAASWLVVALFRHLAGPSWAPAAVACLALLTAASPAGLFVGLVMPDVWAALMILALALLWGGGVERGRAGRALVLAIVTFAALAHGSHAALLAVLGAGALALRLLPRRPRAPRPRGAVAIPVLALGCALAGGAAFEQAARLVHGAPPLARPHLTAHLVDLGPGARHARESCPGSGYALCAHADRLPVDWIDFLFSRDPRTGVFAVAGPAGQRALSDEQLRFAAATLASEPAATLGGLARDGLAQVWTLSLADVPVTREREAFLERGFPPDLVRLIRGSAVFERPGLAAAMTRVAEASSALAAAALALWAAARLGRDRAAGAPAGDPDPGPDPTIVLVVCLAGLLANALICGVLASPYGRFQARVTWILPLMAILVATRALPAAARRARIGSTSGSFQR